MKFIKLNTNQYCLRLERGEEILNSVTSFCKKQKIFSGYFHGIGATDDLMINFFDEKNKKYNSLNFKGP
jgi:predicted DNA-binding protein with PD1-like motif